MSQRSFSTAWTSRSSRNRHQNLKKSRRKTPAEPLIESVVNEAADAEEAFAEKVDITASEMAEDIVEDVKDETGIQEDQE